MQLRTTARDCLSLNWALPRASAPALPEPLRYEVHSFEDQEYIFASALLFQFHGLHYRAAPFLRLAYPQLSVRLYVIDHRGLPAVLLMRLLVPRWVAPLARTLGRQPSEAARFQLDGSQSAQTDAFHWTVERGRKLDVRGRLSGPSMRSDQKLGSWDETLAYFRHRRRVYAVWNQRLRALNTSHPAADVLPLEVEIDDVGLVAECLNSVEESELRRPHSAWLCPEIPFTFEFGKPLHLPMVQRRRPAAEGC